MYLDFFRLREKPFNVTPDPHFLYMSPSHQEAFATLLYGVRERKGFIMVTGEVGTGKTTLLHNLLDHLDEDTQSVFVFHTGMDFIDLLETIHHELNIPFETRTRASLLQSLNRHLIAQLEAGRNMVLIIDEAQNLSPEILEDLRLLSNLETAKDKLLQIILVGQVELEEKMALPQLRQLRQRITVQGRLQALSNSESRAYVFHRLEVAGMDPKKNTLFSEEALSLVCRHGDGIPRQLNVICDNALLIAYAEGSRRVTAKHVRETLRDRGGLFARSRDRDRPARKSPQPAAGRPSLRFFAAVTGLLAVAVLLFGAYRLGMRDWFPDELSIQSRILSAAFNNPDNEKRDSLAEALLAESVDPAPEEDGDDPSRPAYADSSGDLIPDPRLAAPLEDGSEAERSLSNPSTPSPAAFQGDLSVPPSAESNPEFPPHSEALDAPRNESPAQPVRAAENPTIDEPTATPTSASNAEYAFVGSLSPNSRSSEAPADSADSPTSDSHATSADPAPTESTPSASDTTDSLADPQKTNRLRWIEFPSQQRAEFEADAADSLWLAQYESAGGLIRAFLAADSHSQLQAVMDRCSRKAYTVRDGDSFSDVIMQQAGRNDTLALDLLEQLNPHISDLDHIEPGWVIYLPDLKEPSP